MSQTKYDSEFKTRMVDPMTTFVNLAEEAVESHVSQLEHERQEIKELLDSLNQLKK